MLIGATKPLISFIPSDLLLPTFKAGVLKHKMAALQTEGRSLYHNRIPCTPIPKMSGAPHSLLLLHDDRILAPNLKPAAIAVSNIRAQSNSKFSVLRKVPSFLK